MLHDCLKRAAYDLAQLPVDSNPLGPGTEIGLRRALGAARGHIAAQFVSEAALLAGMGDVAGALLGGVATAVYSWARHWSATVPSPVLLAAVGIALALGAAAGALPAWRAARLAPAEALRIV